MNKEEIIALLEKHTTNVWPRVYQLRDEATVADIIAALRADTTPRTRSLLCYTLNLRARAEYFEGKYTETRQAVPALLEALNDTDANVCNEALDALGHIGDPLAGPALLAEYHQAKGDTDWRAVLASTLGFCQYAPAIPVLIEALASPESLLRRHATLGLGYLCAQEAIEPLRQCLKHETDLHNRLMLEETLRELEHPSTQIEKAEHFLSQLRNGKTHEREAAAQTLSGMVNTHVLLSLLALLRDPRSEVRQYAALALAWLRESRDVDWFARAHHDEVIELLIEALQDQENSVQAAAAQALGDWEDARAIEPLLSMVHIEDCAVRKQVIHALGTWKDERILEALVQVFFTDDNLEVRAYAAEGLSCFDDMRAVNALILALQDEQTQVRRDAAEMLSWLKDQRALDALLLALEDHDQEVRSWAIEALWQICQTRCDGLSLEAEVKIRGHLSQAQHDENTEVREGAEKIVKHLSLRHM